MAVKKNDTRILELKKQIDAKEALLKKTEKWAPTTNCNLTLDGQNTNIQALQIDQLGYLAARLKSYSDAAQGMGYMLRVGAYTAQEWIEDIRGKMLHMDRQNELNRLKIMKANMDELLSSEKKTELMLDNMAKELGGV